MGACRLHHQGRTNLESWQRMLGQYLESRRTDSQPVVFLGCYDKGRRRLEGSYADFVILRTLKTLQYEPVATGNSPVRFLPPWSSGPPPRVTNKVWDVLRILLLEEPPASLVARPAGGLPHSCRAAGEMLNKNLGQERIG